MKNRLKYIAIFGLAFTLASCSGTENENGDQEKTEMNNQQGSAAMANLDVKLNDGQQWEANPEIAKGIDKMNFILKEYDGRELSSGIYKEISDRLMEQFDYIYSNSKIEGEGRQQLDNYLQPMKIYFEELNSNDLNVAENSIKKFKQHLAAFPKYFKW